MQMLFTLKDVFLVKSFMGQENAFQIFLSLFLFSFASPSFPYRLQISKS